MTSIVKWPWGKDKALDDIIETERQKLQPKIEKDKDMTLTANLTKEEIAEALSAYLYENIEDYNSEDITVEFQMTNPDHDGRVSITGVAITFSLDE